MCLCTYTHIIYRCNREHIQAQELGILVLTHLGQGFTAQNQAFQLQAWQITWINIGILVSIQPGECVEEGKCLSMFATQEIYVYTYHEELWVTFQGGWWKRINPTFQDHSM